MNNYLIINESRIIQAENLLDGTVQDQPIKLNALSPGLWAIRLNNKKKIDSMLFYRSEKPFTGDTAKDLAYPYIEAFTVFGSGGKAQGKRIFAYDGTDGIAFRYRCTSEYQHATDVQWTVLLAEEFELITEDSELNALYYSAMNRKMPVYIND